MKEDLKVDLHLMKYQVLRFLNTANESITLKQIKSHLVGYFNLSEEYVQELRPSGLNKIFDNNVGWSLEQLKNAGLEEAESRNQHRITDKGREVLQEIEKLLS